MRSEYGPDDYSEELARGNLARMRGEAFLLAFTDGDTWRPGIGDPTVMGWITVAAYFSVALLCFRRRKASEARSRERTFWTVLTVILVFLGVNKQLDLQTFLTLTARRLAIAQGWYENRRVMQFSFVAIVAIVACLGGAWLWRLGRASSAQLRIAMVGFILLLVFVVVRAASFHHVDTLINLDLRGVRMNWILELGALAFLGLGTRTNSNQPIDSAVECNTVPQ